MYQSEFFYGSAPKPEQIFQPMVTSVFDILADDSYCHYCDCEEKETHPKNTAAFIRCIEGEGKIYLESSDFKIKKGDYIFLCFKDIVKYKSLSPVWGYTWVNFIPINTGNEFEYNKIYSSPINDNEETAFCRLLKSGKADKKNQSLISALFLNYFYSVLNCEADDNSHQEVKNNQPIDEMCSFIQQKLYSKIMISDVSTFFKISPRRLHQIFISELGISPKQYIIKKKMEEGYRLLVQTSVPINKIAYSLGFSSPYHFTNEFKKTFNQSPSQVRKMEQTANEQSV